jgi:hypothetical protein
MRKIAPTILYWRTWLEVSTARDHPPRKSDFFSIEAVNALISVSFPKPELFASRGVFCAVEAIPRASYFRFSHRPSVI